MRAIWVSMGVMLGMGCGAFLARADDAKPTGPQFTFGATAAAHWAAVNPESPIPLWARGFGLDYGILSCDAVNGAVRGRLVMQAGVVPTTFYGTVNNGMFQEATVTWKAPVGNGLDISAGLFPSPLGVEGIDKRGLWMWTYAPMAVALASFHTGVRVMYGLDDQWSVMGGVCNGWNTILDNNEQKSVMGSVSYANGDYSTTLLYMGGVERNTGAPEGKPWRHVLDVNTHIPLGDHVALILYGDGGSEATDFGTSAWFGGSGYLRVTLNDRFDVAFRADHWTEKLGHSDTGTIGTASPILFGAPWGNAFALCADWHPAPPVSFRAEVRQDVMAGPFGSPTGTPTSKQTSVSLGMLAAF